MITNLKKTEIVVPVNVETIGLNHVYMLKTYARLTSVTRKKIFIVQINQ